MGTIAITGAGGGIGGATARRLSAKGHKVIGIDVRDADVIADLGTAEGRAAMIAEVTERCGGVLDGMVAGAGVNGLPGDTTVSINYFGAVATLEGFRPLLAKGSHPSAVAISSNSTTTMPGYDASISEVCLTGDEAAARAHAAGDIDGQSSYAASKTALARWVRRHAVTPEWIGAGIRLNAIAPGFIRTPMTAGGEEFIFSLGDIFPMPAGRAGEAVEVAGLLDYLLGPEAGFFVGSLIFMDGGTDAALRADDWPKGM